MLRRWLRYVRNGWKRFRFRLWTARLRIQLRRNGGRLILETSSGVTFDSAPKIDASPQGEGDGTLRLRIGAGAHLGRDATLEVWARGKNTLDLGAGVRLMSGIRFTLRGGKITLGDRSTVRDFSVLKSDGELSVGSRVLVSYRTTLHCTRRIEIGDCSGLGENVSVTDSDHDIDGGPTPYMDRPLIVEPVRIGTNVLISRGVAVVRGATLGDNSAVAANAVVTGGDYPPSWLLGGIPARPIKPLDESRPDAASPSAETPSHQPNLPLEAEPG